jgi:hypothetical protein
MTDVIFDASDNDGSDEGSVADTSKAAYRDLKESGELADQAEKVYEALRAMPYAAVTYNELSNETLAGWEKSTITGRINDLQDHGLVEFAGKRPDMYTGRKCKTWMPVGGDED